MLSSFCLQSRPFTADVPQRCRLTSCDFQSSARRDTKHRRVSIHRRRTLQKQICSASVSSQPENAAGAIAMGLKAYEKQDYNEAIGLFKEALKLPGSGIKQYRDKPAIASDGEKISAFYNIACCLSRTGNTHDGLLALLEALQMGYEDFEQVRSDPDLEGLRADSKFEPLIGRFQKVNRKNILSDFLDNIKNPLQR